uniref:Solute carrier family 2, facilitated glucose transporter member 3 (Trinotate prediction) n=1 Tax=Myxobolus squamalis TaxID=59785 RepID=A0A6B2FWV5_MYXSQ
MDPEFDNIGYSLLTNVDEHENDENHGSNISPINHNPSISRTFLILTLLLIPFSMGEKISLFSRDQYVRLYFPDAYAGGTRIPDLIWGFTNAMFPLGGGIGALSISLISNNIGRKNSVLLCIVVGIMGQIFLLVSYYSQRYVFFVIAKFCDGLSSGSSMNAGLCYFFDLLPPSYVPFCQPTIQLSLIFGLTLSSIFSLDQITQQHWIITSIPLAVTHAILIIILVFLPESPNYLYEKTANYEKTKKIIERLRGKYYRGIGEELDCLIAQNNENAEVKLISTFGFLSDKSLTSSIIVMTAIQLFQQYSGINAVIYYANDFLIKSKFNYEDIGVVFLTHICLFGSLVFTPILTRFSQKTMILIGYCGMSIFFFGAFIAWILNAQSLIVIIFLGGFLFMFQSGPGKHFNKYY